MDIVTTSLEALIQRATCSHNQCPDTAAIDAFCGLINKEPESAQTATRFITAKVHSLQEWEALQALNVLDACMKRCGSSFHMEVGKFRFLNELIKLVSPKYNGAHTPERVKRRVLELMQSWTVYYPKEFKIKEAYEMLKKQGVVKEESVRLESELHKSLEQSTGSPGVRQQDSIFQDTERSRLLQKLLQSKKPDDLQAANRLIKTMVKEDERRVEMNSRHRSELEAAHNNARLLSEMLDSYIRESGSAQDLELIRELHASCLRFQPNVQILLSEIPQQDDRLFNEVLLANDELVEVLEKFNTVIVQGLATGSVGGALLDLSTPSGDGLPPPSPVLAIVSSTDSLLCDQLTAISLDSPLPNSSGVPLTSMFSASLPSPQSYQLQAQPSSHLESLGDIFNSLAQPMSPSSQTLPATSLKSGLEKTVTTKTGLEELDAISESLLKQSLPQVAPQPPKVPAKVPMNQLGSQQSSPLHSNAIHLHSDTTLSTQRPTTSPSLTNNQDDSMNLLMDSITEFPKVNGDLPILDMSSESFPETQGKMTEELKTESQPPVIKGDILVKPLGDITVSLESIKPGNLPPLILLEERGICVTIHFGRDSPRPDISIFVVTTTSSSQFPISNYLFQAIVPKGCRLRLQPPSSMELPAHNPFLPPAAITQVMLIASSTKEPILLRVVVSFTMDDETITEMKEVEKFPLLNS